MLTKSTTRKTRLTPFNKERQGTPQTSVNRVKREKSETEEALYNFDRLLG